jgi:hypothetical protein
MQCRNMAGSLNSNAGDCPQERGCQITCSGDDLPSRVCRTYQQNFLDGTPCDAGGHCSNGNCEGTSTLKAIEQWIHDNPTIFYPVVSVVGVLVLIAVASCFLSCFRRRRARAAPKPAATSNWPSYRGNPPQATTQAYNNDFNNGYNNNVGNNGGNNPPQAYTYSPLPNEQEQWNRHRSVRYA